MKVLHGGQANSKVMYILHPLFFVLLSVLDGDECSDGSHTCDGNATCTNTPGSFMCACNSGYSGNGSTEGTGCTGTNIDMFLCIKYVMFL